MSGVGNCPGMPPYTLPYTLSGDGVAVGSGVGCRELPRDPTLHPTLHPHRGRGCGGRMVAAVGIGVIRPSWCHAPSRRHTSPPVFRRSSTRRPPEAACAAGVPEGTPPVHVILRRRLLPRPHPVPPHPEADSPFPSHVILRRVAPKDLPARREGSQSLMAAEIATARGDPSLTLRMTWVGMDHRATTRA